MTGTMPRRKRRTMNANDFARIRALTRFTQEELADYMGVTHVAVFYYESGQRPIPGPVAFIMRLLEKEHKK